MALGVEVRALPVGTLTSHHPQQLSLIVHLCPSSTPCSQVSGPVAPIDDSLSCGHLGQLGQQAHAMAAANAAQIGKLSQTNASMGRALAGSAQTAEASSTPAGSEVPSKPLFGDSMEDELREAAEDGDVDEIVTLVEVLEGCSWVPRGGILWGHTTLLGSIHTSCALHVQLPATQGVSFPSSAIPSRPH